MTFSFNRDAVIAASGTPAGMCQASNTIWLGYSANDSLRAMNGLFCLAILERVWRSDFLKRITAEGSVLPTMQFVSVGNYVSSLSARLAAGDYILSYR